MKFKVKFGVDTHEFERPVAPTIAEVMKDTSIKLIVGFGDNMRPLIDDVEQPTSIEVPDGAVLELETKANEKQLAA